MKDTGGKAFLLDLEDSSARTVVTMKVCRLMEKPKGKVNSHLETRCILIKVN